MNTVPLPAMMTSLWNQLQWSYHWKHATRNSSYSFYVAKRA